MKKILIIIIAFVGLTFTGLSQQKEGCDNVEKNLSSMIKA